MTTSEMISLAINTQAQGFEREVVRAILDDVHNVLYKSEIEQFRYLDPSTGRPPLLTTQNNVFQYNGNSNCWRVSGLLLRKSSIIDYSGVPDYVEMPDINTTEFKIINGNRYFPYNFAQEADALENASPIITFSRNPGATTAIFYQDGYKKPTPISSDRIQLQIPDAEGAHRQIVFPTLMKYIEAQNNGNYAEAMQFAEAMRVKLEEKLNGAYSGFPGQSSYSRPA